MNINIGRTELGRAPDRDQVSAEADWGSLSCASTASTRIWRTSSDREKIFFAAIMLSSLETSSGSTMATSLNTFFSILST